MPSFQLNITRIQQIQLLRKPYVRGNYVRQEQNFYIKSSHSSAFQMSTFGNAKQVNLKEEKKKKTNKP